MLKNLNIREKINKEIKLNKSEIINCIIFMLFGLITLVTVVMHECWRDEAQAWLLVRDLPIFDLLFSQLRFEGHPGLWYLILTPFVKLGFSFTIINYISWSIMMIAAYFIIYKSKISNLTKFALLLTTPFIYYYSVIGRSYSILTLLMVAIAYVYSKRKEHPYLLAVLLALLINTHVLALGFAGMIILITYIIEPIINRKNLDKKEIKKIILALLIILIAFLLFLVQLKPWLSSNAEINTNMSKFSIGNALLTFELTIKAVIGNVVLYKIFYYVYYLLVPLMLLLGIHHFRKEVLICFFTLAFQLCLFAFVIHSLVHTTVIIFVTLGCYLWMIKDRANKGTDREKLIATLIEIIAFIVFVINIGVSFQYVVYDIKDEFSASKNTANYINNNIEENSTFISTYDAKTESIIPYTNKKYYFICPQTGKEFTYITWDENRREKITYEDFTNCIDENLKDNEPVYILYVYGNFADYVVRLQEDYNIEKVYSDFNTYKGIVRESYVIYKIENKY